MTNPEKYFPEGIAAGSTFINRLNERAYLIKRIHANQHTVLMGPRRYGKTSLVTQVASEVGCAYTAIDLLAAYDEEYVRDQLVNKVSHLVFELLPKINKAKEKLLTIFKKMKPEITLGAFGQRLSLHLSNQPLHDITELLLKLDETAKQFNKKAVIFIDEFQQISQLKNYHAIEAAIRHAVERSENISYVFSGSNRHLLQQMFGDSGRPLYRLCQTLTIERMEKEPYIKHLQQLSKKHWKTALADSVIEQIFNCTELHPYYMNVLCQLLWENKKIPTEDVVKETWHHYVKTQRSVISHDINELSLNQRKIITALAKEAVKEIQSASFIAPLKVSASSANQAVNVLLNNDLLYQDINEKYHVLDPAMRYYLEHILWKNE